MPARDDDYPEVGEIEQDVIADDMGEIEADVLSDNEDEEDEEEFEVESIVAHKMNRGKYMYLVVWKGYGPEHNTWEPEANVEHARDLIEEYWDKRPKATGGSARKRGRPSNVSTGTPSRATKRGRASGAAATSAAPEDEELNYPDTHIDSDAKVKDIADWEGLVKQIDTVERGSDNELSVYLTMKSGERLQQSAKLCRKRCPQALLDFYESHLKWRNG